MSAMPCAFPERDEGAGDGDHTVDLDLDLDPLALLLAILSDKSKRAQSVAPANVTGSRSSGGC